MAPSTLHSEEEGTEAMDAATDSGALAAPLQGPESDTVSDFINILSPASTKSLLERTLGDIFTSPEREATQPALPCL